MVRANLYAPVGQTVTYAAQQKALQVEHPACPYLSAPLRQCPSCGFEDEVWDWVVQVG